MESLVFTFGMIAGGTIAFIVMSMLFVAKSADENEVAVRRSRPSHTAEQEGREELKPIIPCAAQTAVQKL